MKVNLIQNTEKLIVSSVLASCTYVSQVATTVACLCGLAKERDVSGKGATEKRVGPGAKLVASGKWEVGS